MKRPEGFDRPPETGAAAPAKQASGLSKRFFRKSADTGGADNSPVQVPEQPPESSLQARAASEPGDKAAHRHLRRAARARRRYEHREVRRFTRHSRRRKVTWFVVGGIVVTMASLLAVAVYSPLLALKSIEIDGASRIDPADILAAVDGQLETPLALVDFDRMTEELGDFPLIRSYVTETIPPDTLRIHIVEREPIGSLPSGSGFMLVDPAGIVIERSETRLPGVPLIDITGKDSDSLAFDAAVEVLVALPDAVLAQLDTITASTRDDVRLTLTGSGAQVIWGSAADSDYKARVLEDALANFPDVSEYNVSAPGQFTYR